MRGNGALGSYGQGREAASAATEACKLLIWQVYLISGNILCANCESDPEGTAQAAGLIALFTDLS